MIGVDASESNIAIANLHASRDPFLPYSPSPPAISSGSLRRTWFSRPPKPAAREEGSLEYRHTSAEALRDAGETFDVVCAMEVLEHVDEPGEFLRSLGDMVRVSRSRLDLDVH